MLNILFSLDFICLSASLHSLFAFLVLLLFVLLDWSISQLDALGWLVVGMMAITCCLNSVALTSTITTV